MVLAPDARVLPGAPSRDALGVSVALGVGKIDGEPKINHVERVPPPADAQQQVLGLEVAVEEARRVHVADAREGLVGDEEDRLEREPPAAVVEEVLERGAERVLDQRAVFALVAEPPHARDPDAAGQRLAYLLFVSEEQGFFVAVARELYGDFFAGFEVGTCRALGQR